MQAPCKHGGEGGGGRGGRDNYSDHINMETEIKEKMRKMYLGASFSGNGRWEINNNNKKALHISSLFRVETKTKTSVWIYQMEVKVVSKGIHVVSLLAERPIPLTNSLQPQSFSLPTTHTVMLENTGRRKRNHNCHHPCKSKTSCWKPSQALKLWLKSPNITQLASEINVFLQKSHFVCF